MCSQLWGRRGERVRPEARVGTNPAERGVSSQSEVTGLWDAGDLPVRGATSGLGRAGAVGGGREHA